MIEIILDHSYEDDYFMISVVEVNLKDASEKERVKKLAEKLVGKFVDVDNGLRLRIAKLLGVDEKLIYLDTNEIDLM